jgi:polysaccharide biosynthesis/export protein
MFLIDLRSVSRAVALGLVWAGLLATADEAAAQATPARPAAPSTSAMPPPASTANAQYRLAAGDVIRVTVFQNPDLSLEARVSESGVISYPLLGAVQLGGMSVAQAERRIADGLRDGNFVKQPQVSILVSQVRGNQVSVLGQVGRPGRYPLEVADLRLTASPPPGRRRWSSSGCATDNPSEPSSTCPRSSARVAAATTSCCRTAMPSGSNVLR